MWRHVLAQLAAVTLVILVAAPALEVGFLADDFHAVRSVHEAALESPGFTGAVREAFVRRWTDSFDVFRPLTLLTIRLDLVLHGTDPWGYHLTNLLLWLLVAVVFGSLVSAWSGHHGALAQGFSTLLFGLYPAAVEGLAWMVAREDLLVTLFGLLALRFYMAAPRRARLWGLPLALAFLCKETAVVLPPLLLWVELVGRPARHAGQEQQAPLRRLAPHAWSFGLLGLYMAVRKVLFGHVGATYAGRSFLDVVGGEGALAQVGSSLAAAAGALLVPVNGLRLESLAGWATPWLPALLFLPCWGVVLVGAARQGRGGWRLIVAVLGWMLLPLLLVAPVLHVGAGLEVGRVLLLPAAGLLLVPALLLRRLAASRALLCLKVAAVLLAAGTLRLNLGAWEEATRRVADLRADLGRVEARRPVIFVGLEGGGTAPIREALVKHGGAWLLSGAARDALLPPFRRVAPGRIEIIRAASLAALPAEDLATLSSTDAQMLGCRITETGPRFVPLGPRGGRPVLGASLRPEPDGPLPRDRAPTLLLQWPDPTSLHAGARLRLVLTDLDGNHALLETPLQDVAWEVGGRAPRASFPGARFQPSLTPELLQALASPAAVMWAEVRSGSGSYVRSRVTIRPLAPRP